MARTAPTPDDLQHDFDLERLLASRLRSATASDRLGLYAKVYDQFVKNARSLAGPTADPREIARQVRIVTRFLSPGGTYLEIGAGRCGVAAQVALSARSVQVVEVSAAITSPALGVEIIIADGVAIPVTERSIDLAFSNQVLEHLHPDDAYEHARNVHRSLAPGGAYVCITPNRLTGPHDITKHFGDVAQGFHLREYSIRDQYDLFVSAGFREVRVAIALGGEILALMPANLYGLAESLSARAPRAVRHHRLLAKLLNPGAVVAFV